MIIRGSDLRQLSLLTAVAAIFVVASPAFGPSNMQIVAYAALSASVIAQLLKRGVALTAGALVAVTAALGIAAWFLVLAATSAAALSSALPFLVPLWIGVLAALARDKALGCALTTGLLLAAIFNGALGAFEVFIRSALLVDAPFRSRIYGFPRAAGMTGSVFSLAYLAVLALMLLMSMNGQGRHHIKPALRAAILSLLALGLLSTWTLGAWLTLALGVVWIVAPQLRNDRTRRRQAYAVSVAVLLVLSWSAATGDFMRSHGDPSHPLAAVWQRTENLQPGAGANLERQERWSQAIQQIGERPWSGYELNYWSGSQRLPHDSPESWYLLIAREAGLPALVLYLIIMAGLVLGKREPLVRSGLFLAAAGFWVMHANYAPLGMFLAYAATVGWRTRAARADNVPSSLSDGSAEGRGVAPPRPLA